MNVGSERDLPGKEMFTGYVTPFRSTGVSGRYVTDVGVRPMTVLHQTPHTGG